MATTSGKVSHNVIGEGGGVSHLGRSVPHTAELLGGKNEWE
jgi:hypothetical protein